jgi:hypothetical protein
MSGRMSQRVLKRRQADDLAVVPDLFAERKRLFGLIENNRDSKVLLYVTGDRPSMETEIHGEVIDIFAEHLDALFPTKRISLILYTRGGDTLAAWNLANLVRMFCDELEVIIPAKAHSAGTLLALGADRIIMTKQATLGPIDPSITGPLNPQIPGAPAQARTSVSVEAVRGYLEMVKTDAGIRNPDSLVSVVVDLAQKIHPLVLGQIFRSRNQIQYLAGRLLTNQVADEGTKRRVIEFLSSESGSHDYTINRREAAALGLKVENANWELYAFLKPLYATIREELQLGVSWNPNAVIAESTSVDYRVVRCLIETVAHGSHMFLSEGTLTKVQSSDQAETVKDARVFDGWKKR